MAEPAAPPSGAVATAGRQAQHLRLLQAIALVFLLIKLIYILKAGPIADEAYYWIWGRHFELSYFDHPPLQPWLLGVSDLIFGRSLLALRWLTLATLAGTFYIYHLWAKRFAGADWQAYFWPGVVIYLASPTFGFFSSLAMHDYLLVFLALVSGHFFITYFADVAEKGRGRLVDLYLGALFLGLTGLTKYSAVLFGLGVLGFVLASRPLRPLLKSPHLYLAALLALVLQLPYIVWNVQNGFASFRFHLEDRHPSGWLDSIKLNTLGDFIGVSILLVGPFLVPAFVRFLIARPAAPFERSAQGLGRWVFWVSSGFFLVVALFDEVWWWWNLLAYVLLLPFAAKYMGQRLLFYGHVVFGLVVQGFLLISSVAVPLLMLWGGSDFLHANLFGWDQLPAPMAALEEKYHPGFIAAAGADVASIVGYALNDANVTTVVDGNEFQFLFDRAAHRGQSALVVLRDDVGKAVIASQFSTVTPVATIPIERFGVDLGRYDIYLASNYHPIP